MGSLAIIRSQTFLLTNRKSIELKQLCSRRELDEWWERENRVEANAQLGFPSSKSINRIAAASQGCWLGVATIGGTFTPLDTY